MPATGYSRPERLDRDVVVDLINQVDRFADLQAEWTDLLGQSSANNPFLSWEWLHAWWVHLAGTRRLQILTARSDDGRLIGIAPLSPLGRARRITGRRASCASHLHPR